MNKWHCLMTISVGVLFGLWPGFATAEMGFGPAFDANPDLDYSYNSLPDILNPLSPSGPSLDCDGEGHCLIAVNTNENRLAATGIIAVQKSDNGGRSFGPPLFFNPSNGYPLADRQPALAMGSNGTALLSWSGNLYRSSDSGTSWTQIASPLPDPASIVGFDLGSDDNGSWLLAWAELSGVAYVSTSYDGGWTWTEPRAWSDDATEPITSSLSIGLSIRGAWMISWKNETSILATRSMDQGLTWSPPIAVCDDCPNDPGVIGNLAHDERGAWLRAWLGSGVDYGISRDDGLTWELGQIVDEVGHPAYVPPSAIIGRRGEMVIGWTSNRVAPTPPSYYRYNRTDIRAAVLPDAAITWRQGFINGDALHDYHPIYPPGCPEFGPCDAPIDNFDGLVRFALNSDGNVIGGWVYIEGLVYAGSNGNVTVRCAIAEAPASDASAEANFTVGGGNAYDWLGGAASGDAGTSATFGAGGLCMFVPEGGANTALWISPEWTYPQVDLNVTRFRFDATTDQTDPDRIPLWDLFYDNFTPPPSATPLSYPYYKFNYGGDIFFMDAAGGANGVGRAQGRRSFEAWIMPNASETRQWRVGFQNGQNYWYGAYDYPSSVAKVAFRVGVRVLDNDAGGYGAEFDSGSICMSGFKAHRFPLAALKKGSAEWSPPILSTNFAPETLDQTGHGYAPELDDEKQEVTYRLTPSGPGSRKTLIPFDAASFNPENPNNLAPFFPINWKADTLYKLTANIRSAAPPGPETYSQVDMISLGFDTGTHELQAYHFSIKDNLWAMPLDTALTDGVAQPYSAFFYSHNPTLMDPTLMPGANGIRPYVDFFNIRPSGNDRSVTVENLRVVTFIPPY